MDGSNGNTGGGGTMSENKIRALKTKTKVVAWNVRGLTGNEKEVEDNLTMRNVDFSEICETKKKDQSTKRTFSCDYPDRSQQR